MVEFFGSNKCKAFLYYMVEPRKWLNFLERLLALVVISIFLFIVWMFPVSPVVSYFYSATTSGYVQIPEDTQHKGVNTVNSINYRLKGLLDEGLITNFLGVKFWIDNRLEEQIGEIQMYRTATYMLENHLGRNRGTGGANHNLTQARADIFSDYELPWFTSYTRRLKQTTILLDSYTEELIADYDKEMNKKRAVFVVNSDNLAEVIDKLKQDLQTNNAGLELHDYFQEDNKYYRLRGNLIALHYIFGGIDRDFRQKLIDKSLYELNFVPLMERIDEAVNHKPAFVIYHYINNDLATMRGLTERVANMMGELRDKLKNG